MNLKDLLVFSQHSECDKKPEFCICIVDLLQKYIVLGTKDNLQNC